MPSISMKELLEAGVHFGHQTKRWNPKMKEYIFGERNGIYIIDLQKTLKLFKDAMRFVGEQAAAGKTVMFVGTKRQAQEAIAEEATRCGQFYVNNRWLGGLLTNFLTVKQSLKRLKELDELFNDETGGRERRTKKELIGLERERGKLMQNLAGIKNMTELPDLLFVIDSNKESIAVKEARKLGIPVVGVVDTNCDPDEVTWPIPGNENRRRRGRRTRARQRAGFRSQGIGHHRRGPGRGHVAVCALCRPAVERGCAHRGHFRHRPAFHVAAERRQGCRGGHREIVVVPGDVRRGVPGSRGG